MARRKKKSETTTIEAEPAAPLEKTVPTGPKSWRLELLGVKKLVTVAPLGEHQYSVHDAETGNFITTCGVSWFEQNAVDPDR